MRNLGQDDMRISEMIERRKEDAAAISVTLG
jgi:hypothetical protein